MGGICCTPIERVPSLQRLRYDMTSVMSKNLPLVWMVGLPGSGLTTQGEMLEDRLNYINIIVPELLKEESCKDTDRGKIIKHAYKNRVDRIPESIVIDLIKERMLSTLPNARGFLVIDFPTTARQGGLFETEIAPVHTVVYLHADVNTLIARLAAKAEKPIDPIQTKKMIINTGKQIHAAIKSFNDKVEKISTNTPLGETYGKIQGAIHIHYKSTNPNADLIVGDVVSQTAGSGKEALQASSDIVAQSMSSEMKPQNY